MLEQVAKLWSTYSYVYLEGLAITLWLSVISVFFATILGTLLAVMKLSRFKPLNWFVDIYLWILRGTPVLLHLYFFWLLLPRMFPALDLSNPDSVQLPDSPFVLDDLLDAIVATALARFEGNKTKTADYLGISRFALHRRLQHKRTGSA